MTKNFFEGKWLKDQFNERNPGQRSSSDAQPKAAASTSRPELAPLWILWGRVDTTGSEFVAVASAIPNNGPESALKTVLRAFATEELAQAAVASMLRELGDTVRAEGGRVADVETDGV